MKSDFKLVGLTLPRSATLEFLHTDKETFWAKIDMPDDRCLALFNLAKNDDTFWEEKKIAVVEHDGFYEDGTPQHPKMIEVKGI